MSTKWHIDSRLYSVIYNDGDICLLDPEETKKQVDLHNNMNDYMNDDYDEKNRETRDKIMGK